MVSTLVLVSAFAVSLLEATYRSFGRSAGAPATRTDPRRLAHSIGSPILGMKLSRLQVLTSRIGVGVTPITTYSGELIWGLIHPAVDEDARGLRPEAKDLLPVSGVIILRASDLIWRSWTGGRGTMN